MDKNNIILIKGGAYNKIKRALNQWLRLYYDNLDDDFSFELNNISNNEHVIVVAGRLDNVKFNYLVNYLNYTIGIDYKVNIEGYTTATDSGLYPKEFLNRKLLVYIPEADNEGDNVYAVTSENQNLKISFRGKIKVIDSFRYYKYPDFEIERLENPELIKINKKKILLEKGLAYKDDVKKRFWIVTIIFLTLYLVGFLFIRKTINFLVFTGWLSIMVMFWYGKDYKMLQIDEYYYLSLLFSLLIFIYGLILQTQVSISNSNYVIELFTKLPLIFLLFQSPIRHLFRKIVKREPIVERPVKTFEDGLYILVLLTATFSTALLISYYFRK
jgi:hypothetical protein